MIRTSSHRAGVFVTLAVCLLGSLSLIVGWGFGIDRFVRINQISNAMVPVTLVCLILLSLASLPSRRYAKFQLIMLVGTILAMIFAKLMASPSLLGLFVFDVMATDGLSYATILGMLIATISPAIRLGVIPLDPDWEFHAPLFGLLMGVVAIFVLTFDPISFSKIQPFTHLSLYTPIGLSLIYLSQLLFVDFLFDETEEEKKA